MSRVCAHCGTQRPILKRPRTLEALCRECFYKAFEDEIHQTIVSSNMFKPGERMAICASGGKDSTVLAHTMTTLNARHNYGLDLFLLSIDEGIAGYRDDSLETVKRNEATYGIPLKVVSYKELYGWTMDEIVREIGTKSNCTFCGVFRRQALDRGAALMGAHKLATGHNADDVAETALLNVLRGDIGRLGRCMNIITGEDSAMPRVKPFKYTYEKEIVMYAYFKKLDYFSTECLYAPFAARGFTRDFVKDLEAVRPRAVIDLIRSAESFRVAPGVTGKMPAVRNCERCGYISSQPVCKACLMLEGLNSGLPRLGVSKTKRGRPAGAAAAGRAGIRIEYTEEGEGACGRDGPAQCCPGYTARGAGEKACGSGGCGGGGCGTKGGAGGAQAAAVRADDGERLARDSLQGGAAGAAAAEVSAGGLAAVGVGAPAPG